MKIAVRIAQVRMAHPCDLSDARLVLVQIHFRRSNHIFTPCVSNT